MMGEFAGAIGYVAVFALLCAVGVIIAKKSNWAWALYGLAVLFQMSAFSGWLTENRMYGAPMRGFVMTLFMAIALAALFFILIWKRRKRYGKAKTAEDETSLTAEVGRAAEENGAESTENGLSDDSPEESSGDEASAESGTEKETTEEPDTKAPSDVPENEGKTTETENAAPKSSARYCSKCGSPVDAETGVCSVCGRKDPSAKRARSSPRPAVWILALLATALLGGNIYQYGENTKQAARLTQITGEYDQMTEKYNQALSDLSITEENYKQAVRANEALNGELSSAKDAQGQYKANSDKYSTIINWIDQHASEYKKASDYFAGSNVIAVKVGETVALDVTYKGNRYMWEKTTTGRCKADWGKDWSDNTTQLEITGVRAGTSEIVFYLGDEEHADTTESFRVLVIVV